MSHIAYIGIIRTENVQAPKPLGSPPAGAKACGSLSRKGGHRRKGKAEEPEIEARRGKAETQASRKIAAQQQHHKRSPAAASSQKKRTELQPPRHLLGKCLRDESSPVAQFGGAAPSGLGAASTARAGGRRGGGRGARLSNRACVRKGRRDTSATDRGPGVANYGINMEISASLSDALYSKRPESWRD